MQAISTLLETKVASTSAILAAVVSLKMAWNILRPFYPAYRRFAGLHSSMVDLPSTLLKTQHHLQIFSLILKMLMRSCLTLVVVESVQEHGQSRNSNL